METRGQEIWKRSELEGNWGKLGWVMPCAQ